MDTVLQIMYFLFLTLSQALISPIYWVVVFIVYIQYKRIGKMEEKILGTMRESILRRVFSSALSGCIGGLIGSIVIIVLGVTIEANDFMYILILALFLMLIHPRFICFSYAGGIVSLSSLVFGYPEINVSSVMAIVAVLHLVESMLIMIDGEKSKIPIFIERGNNLVGGFNMVRFWPIPFIVLLISNNILEGSSITMPQWWPLFKPEVLSNIGNNDLMYIMFPVLAILGYGDMAITDYPERKAKRSAINLSLFSIILLILATISSHVYVFKYIAAIFSPTVHELLIQLGRRKEKKGLPLFIPSNKGVRILDLLPNSVASKMGIKTGDIIFRINGFQIRSKYEIEGILSTSPSYIWIDYYDSKGNIKSAKYTDYKNKVRSLGIIVVPKDPSYTFIVKEAEGIGIRLLKWLKRKIT